MRVSDHINCNLSALSGPIRPEWILREGEHRMELVSCTAHLVSPATPGANETLAFRWKFISLSQLSFHSECYIVWTALGETSEESPLFALLSQMFPGLFQASFYQMNLDDLVGRKYRAELVHRMSETGSVYVEHLMLSPLEDLNWADGEETELALGVSR